MRHRRPGRARSMQGRISKRLRWGRSLARTPAVVLRQGDYDRTSGLTACVSPLIRPVRGHPSGVALHPQGEKGPLSGRQRQSAFDPLQTLERSGDSVRV